MWQNTNSMAMYSAIYKAGAIQCLDPDREILRTDQNSSSTLPPPLKRVYAN